MVSMPGIDKTCVILFFVDQCIRKHHTSTALAWAVSQHIDTSKNIKAWAVSQHIDTSKNIRALAVSQHTDTSKNTN